MLISDEYRTLNRVLHKQRKGYGVGGARFADAVRRLVVQYDCKDVLDYGCGKGWLAKAIGNVIPVHEYDPAVKGKDALPSPADLVVCTDVLEHVEPDCLDAVLDHLHGKTMRVALLSIATRPSTKLLADGRNAHLIVESGGWWIKRLDPYFHMLFPESMIEDGQLTLLATPR